MIPRAIKFFTSLRLTVVCLAFAVALVFLGSVAQVDEGLYQAQNRWFRSFVVLNAHVGWLPVPIFPGGYLIGGVLLINLVAAHFARFKLTWSKTGIHLTHLGIVLLLLGQLATDLLSRETVVRFGKGETRQYSESARRNELVFMTDAASQNEDDVVAIPESLVARQGDIRNASLPFAVRVRNYYVNAEVEQRPANETAAPPANQGIGVLAQVTARPEERDPNKRNVPAAVLELIGPDGSLGTWLVSASLSEPQEFSFGGKTWRMALRWEREYLPYSLQLLGTKYEVYPGTDTPKNFQSRVRIENPSRSENREVDIYMNNPLRYEGRTFYQFQMDRGDVEASRGSALQVVKNPSWLTPYAGCALVGGGMVIQFLSHLIKFISKRRKA